MNSISKFMLIGLLSASASFLTSGRCYAQDQPAISTEASDKAKEWVSALGLSDAKKIKMVETGVATHLTLVKNWHDTHPASTVPAGINPVTGSKLSDLDRQIIADSAMPSTVHQELMKTLNENLSTEQVEAILDKYTIGKVAFTLKGYQSIVPNFTPVEEAKILGYLKEAREMAIDYKSMKEISAIFEIYKTKAEQYLNANGRNWRTMYGDYTKKIKAEKAAKKQ